MKKTFLFACLMVCAGLSNILATENVPDFGTVLPHEVQMTAYEKDKTAEAVVLHDIGKSWFMRSDNGFDVVFERRVRIKIFNKAGYRHAEAAIWFYQEGNIFEKVSDIAGYTYNFVNGQLTKTALDIRNTYEEKASESWNIKKFAMPDVKEGSIIEYKYTIVSPYVFNLRDWEFQSSIPVIYSEYEARMIPFYEYRYILQGATKFDVFESKPASGMGRQFGHINFNDMVYRFGIKDVPAFRDEEYITSRNDYIMKIDFQLSYYTLLSGAKIDVITTWPKLCNDLVKHTDFGRYAAASEKAASKIINFEAMAGKEELEKIEQVVNAVKKNFSWNHEYRSYANKTVNEFLKDKTGGSANINLFLTGALRAAGIDAVPVWISTRSHGKIKVDYPFEHFFNSTLVLARFTGKMLLLDATDPHCPFNAVPPECINDRGLIIEKNSEKWVEVASPVNSSTHKSFQIEVHPESDSLICRFDIRAIGYDGVNLRKNFLDKPENVRDIFLKKDLRVIDTISFYNFEDNTKPYNARFVLMADMETFSNKIYISPFLHETLAENPFKQNERSYPIDMISPHTKVFNSTVKIPEGYQVESLPKNYHFSNDQIEIDYKTLTEDGLVKCSGSYQFKKAVYQPDEYSRIKFLFNEIIRTFNQKAVFVKTPI